MNRLENNPTCLLLIYGAAGALVVGTGVLLLADTGTLGPVVGCLAFYGCLMAVGWGLIKGLYALADALFPGAKEKRQHKPKPVYRRDMADEEDNEDLRWIVIAALDQDGDGLPD